MSYSERQSAQSLRMPHKEETKKEWRSSATLTKEITSLKYKIFIIKACEYWATNSTKIRKRDDSLFFSNISKCSQCNAYERHTKRKDKCALLRLTSGLLTKKIIAFPRRKYYL